MTKSRRIIWQSSRCFHELAESKSRGDLVLLGMPDTQYQAGTYHPILQYVSDRWSHVDMLADNEVRAQYRDLIIETCSFASILLPDDPDSLSDLRLVAKVLWTQMHEVFQPLEGS